VLGKSPDDDFCATNPAFFMKEAHDEPCVDEILRKSIGNPKGDGSEEEDFDDSESDVYSDVYQDELD